ncbi:endoglucanase [Pseudonocardiaceae bacterium YIM PH 21723]|nr:endoglucanase [Pseudonocardiaceae bacterium YIM PH 21723]
MTWRTKCAGLALLLPLLALTACDERATAARINRPSNPPITTVKPVASSSSIAPSPTTKTPPPNSGSAAYSPYTSTQGFYVDPTSNAAKWVRSNPGDSRASTLSQLIAAKPAAKAFDNWNGQVKNAVDEYVSAAAAKNQLPVLIGYNLPFRDCGQYSHGGAANADEYRTWVRDVSAGIANRPSVLILEPDSLIHLDCLSEADRRTRVELLKDAGQVLGQQSPKTWVYMDGSDGRWTDPSEMADRLAAAGVGGVRGYTVNVANFNTTDQATSYGKRVKSVLKMRYNIDSGFVVDISRNGNGSDGSWCNPPGRRIGGFPQVGGPNTVDALLWIKKPGESDGNCGVAQGTKSGEFIPDLAMQLAGG